jgi:hypothetical protein
MSSKRQNYSYWRFFNKDGDNHNFTYDETNDVWKGTVYLDKISTGLIEYEPIYIMADVWDAVNNERLGLRKPRKANLTPWCPGATQTNIIARWKDTIAGSTASNVEEFFLWEIEGYPGPDPQIVKSESLDIDLGSFDGDLVGPSGGGGTGQLAQGATSTSFDNTAISLKVGLQSNEEDSYSRVLQLVDPNYLTEDSYSVFGCTGSTHVFAEITFYGETEGEDERLETMIENMGNAIKNSDFKIFDDTDINEALPDFVKLNYKRKELLLEWDNIFPYTGSYKALINILKYFGYDQVTLKEYWLNIDELKGNNPENVSRIRYKQTPIEDLFSTDPKTASTSKNIIPSKLYKKTSKFGLFYDITRDSGEFDDDGIPIVEEAFTFSNEEILIKLFALKQKLKKYFLPLNARIVDIVGEAVYYTRYDVNIWSDLIRVDDIELNTDPCIKAYPETKTSLVTNLIEDNFLGVKVPPDLNMAGISDFVVYAFGVTQTGPLGSGDYSGVGDEYVISDSVSGATFGYVTPSVGLTSGQIIDGIINEWKSKLTEPWTQFELTKDKGQDSTDLIPSPAGYKWFYATQKNIIGPTGGVGFTGGISASPGPTSFTYTTPGATVTGDLAPGLTASPLSDYASAFLGFFRNNNRTITETNDYPCAPIAAPFVLENCTFSIDWDTAKINWNQLDYVDPGTGIGTNYSAFNYSYIDSSYPIGPTNPYAGLTGPTASGPSGGTSFAGGATPGNPFQPPGPTYVSGYTGLTGPTANPVLYTWKNVAYNNFYELRWVITHDEDTSYVIDSGLLSLDDGEKFPILLEKTGTYTVELYLYDSLGGISKITENSYLTVDTKDVDFIGHFTFREEDYEWQDQTILRQSDIVPAPKKPQFPSWNVYNSTWDLPLQENEQVSMQDLTYNDLDKIEFYQTQNDPQYQGYCADVTRLPEIPGVSGSAGLYDLDSYHWNLIQGNASWNDVYHLWWDSMLPKIAKIKIDYPTAIGTTGATSVTMAMFKKPFVGKPDKVELVNDLSSMLSYGSPTYGLIVKNMDAGATGITNVYQYLGGPTGSIGGSSWVESDINIDTYTFDDLTDSGSLSGNNIWREFVRQLNIELQDNGDTHDIINEFITYYKEEYTDPLNPLDPMIELVSKDKGQGNNFYLKLFSNGPTYTPLNIYDASGATANYVQSYPAYWSNFGDIPYFVEIFAVGASGGTIHIPGPSSWVGYYGETITGTTHWPYTFGATNLEDLWSQLDNKSRGLNSGGTGPIAVSGPITDYEWNIVYGASGYTGPTGSTAFPPPSSLTPIKIQGYKKTFSSNDYQCVYFTGGTVLGGTGGMAGTMCGRSITNNPSWDTLRIHKYAKEFPLLTQISFNYSLSEMDGKVKPTWELIRENDENWENIYYNNPYFSYLFTQKGSYTINLTIEDGNGNKKTKTKKEFVKII